MARLSRAAAVWFMLGMVANMLLLSASGDLLRSRLGLSAFRCPRCNCRDVQSIYSGKLAADLAKIRAAGAAVSAGAARQAQPGDGRRIVTASAVRSR